MAWNLVHSTFPRERERSETFRWHSKPLLRIHFQKMSREIMLWIPARFLTSLLLYCTFWVIMDLEGYLIIYWNGFVSFFLLFVVEYMSQASFDFSTLVIFNCSLFCCLFCRYRWQGWEILFLFLYTFYFGTYHFLGKKDGLKFRYWISVEHQLNIEIDWYDYWFTYSQKQL